MRNNEKEYTSDYEKVENEDLELQTEKKITKSVWSMIMIEEYGRTELGL